MGCKCVHGSNAEMAASTVLAQADEVTLYPGAPKSCEDKLKFVP